MKFKLDENMPMELTEDLRGLGHDADTVTDEGLRGAEDLAVIEAASKSERILFTLDKGIANLRRYPVHQHAGVVLFRPHTSGGARSCLSSALGSLKCSAWNSRGI